MSIMRHWQTKDRIGRMKQWWDGQGTPFDPNQHRSTELYRWLIEAMQAAPIPDLLHRTALRDCRVGGVRVSSGDRVVLSVASAAEQCPKDDAILFGGDYADKQGLTHACPGRPLAIGVLLGMTAALLDRPAPRFVAPLTLGVGVS